MTNDMRHTPGPWATDIETVNELNEGLDAVVYVDHGSGKGGEIACFRHDPDDGMNTTDPETIANAMVMADAPALLASLEIMVEQARAHLPFIGNNYAIQDRINDADALIAKHTEQSSLKPTPSTYFDNALQAVGVDPKYPEGGGQ